MATEVALPRFRVKVRRYPLTGFVNKDGEVSTQRPKKMFYQPKSADYTTPEGRTLPIDVWHTAEELKENYGLTTPPKGWRSRKRPAFDEHSAFNFEGIILEAHNEDDACGRFKKRFGLRDVREENWTVERVDDNEPLGLCNPIKSSNRKLHRTAFGSHGQTDEEVIPSFVV